MKNPHVTAIAFATALAFAITTSVASAAVMEYSFSGVAAGSLAGSAFADTAFVIVGRADPINSAACGANCRFLDFASAEVRLDGMGNFALLSPTRVFNNQGNLGLSRGGADGLDLYSVFTVASDYDFAAAFGPVSQLASLQQWQASASAGIDAVVTSGGTLVFPSGETQGSFEAKVAGVPLPGSGGLLATALLAGAVSRRRRAC